MTRFVRNLTFLLIAAVMSSAVAGQSLVFRSGGTQGATDTLTRSCVVRETSSPGNATVVEATTLDLGSTPSQPGGHGLIDFPQIIGTGPSQVPAGATIQSATLELYCIAAGGGSSSARTVHCKVLSDYPHRLGPWIEPVTTSAVAQLAVGASWLARDTRITGQRPWSPLTTSGGPSVVTDPAILAALPGLNAQLTFTPNGSPGVGQYHAFNVTQAVQVWARGFSNQGFLISVNSNGLPVTYAADDHPTAAWRPRLTVTWGGPPNPFSILLNRVPEGLGTAPANPTTATGVPFSILLLANDPDGTNPEFVVIDQPKHGRLEGVVPYLSYYPDAGFVGQDDFSFIARDAIATSFLKTVAIQVTGGGGSQSATWQEGIAPAGDVTRACTAKWSRSLGAQVTYEDTTFRAQKEFRQGFLDFPQLFGTQGQRIPLGSTIVSARLELTMASVANNGVPRTLSLHRIIDPLDRAMTWHEPAITLSESQPAVPNQGVSHLFLDARATPPDAWSK
ncbi:MAG: hypothetical protein KDB53_18470, partial [Planctomycetes bacterium]|nr:hypothetical protein [Planctomycetota bacterium]